ncbi:MAG: GTP cyclohydrolase I FolE [Candidatus Fraserbacteria bacterium RBG_16_55_9]|uniref:GTP cyclohydrolase 1 n=1 Tax=Fraserbacteria sp. (strain RBG_16_55_9) TaxID=1817864 RepID=A0A1F5UYD2_FRAXR|nr:MAG: GTP cyclohydrolase I FolE [Candidatus Fraserbacteria bacterium RBG_16_55_9]
MGKHPNGKKDIKELVRELLLGLGEDPKREGLRETPRRVAELYNELTQGYREDPQGIVGDAVFTVDYDSMVVLKDIEFYSLCEHHLIPFFGHVHVGYIPKGQVIGASKIPRVVDSFAKRLQLQERMTEEIACFLEEAIQPLGLGVVVEGMHLCMAMRGVEKRDAWMVTSAMKGSFRKDAKTRAEFLQFIAPRLER